MQQGVSDGRGRVLRFEGRERGTLLSVVGCPLSAGGGVRLEEEILWTYPQGFAQPLPGEGA